MNPARRRIRSLLTAVLGAACLLPLTAASASAATSPVPVPADGSAYYGVNLDWFQDSPSAYTTRSGLAPSQYGDFVSLPLTSGAKAALSSRVDTIAAQQARLFLTVEPGPLSTVTQAVTDDLATTLGAYNARGVDVLLRFAHEMNGSWYAWGQQPAAYVAAYQRVADAVHAKAPRTAMVWAPNYGGGYPFTGGTYAAKAGTASFVALDTDGNGSLTMADDPYAPYYPGDTYVDWVGLTAYHFGNAWPWGENEVPEAGKLGQFLRGTYTGNGRYEDQSAVPDFYESFASGKSKPMVISETSALYNEATTAGASHYDITRAWLDQVYSLDARDAFPMVKAVNWFEIRKYEGETASVIDWRATADPQILTVLRGHALNGRYVFAGTSAPPAPTPPAPTVTVPGAPATLTVSSTPNRLTASWRAPATDGGAPVTGYRACLNGTTRCVEGSSTTAVFDGLTRRTTYSISVQARNSAGLGPATTTTASTK